MENKINVLISLEREDDKFLKKVADSFGLSKSGMMGLILNSLRNVEMKLEFDGEVQGQSSIKLLGKS